MWVNRRRLLSLAAAAATTPVALQLARSQVEAPSSSNQFVFPGLQWEAASPEELGWSIQGLAEAYRLFATLPPASLVVINRGRIVAAWGDVARKVKLSSIRKSLLSALYGKPVFDGRVNLDATFLQGTPSDCRDGIPVNTRSFIKPVSARGHGTRLDQG